MGNEFITSINSDNLSGIIKLKNKYKCKRCGNSDQRLFVNVPNDSIYCRCCIDNGKVSDKTGLNRSVIKNESNPITIKSSKYLTPIQSLASKYMLENINCGKPILIWAVCGAGKTEILYPLIEYCINNNLTFCWATPRKDIVIELSERFKNDFKGLNVISLYGGSDDTGKNGNFVVSTTHQLINFYRYFDVIVVDEIDAFPYKNNELLEFFVKKSLKDNGKLVYLTATPSKEMISNINNRKLLKYIVPLRFHGFLLPEPKVKMVLNKKKMLVIDKGSLLYKLVVDSLEINKKIMIFVPTKNIGIKLEDILCFKGVYARFVYANMKDKEEVINAFREGCLNVIITTIILERGVTFSNVDVIVLEANHHVFDESSLIQIAGRVGRKLEYPFGNVYFICSEYTRDIKDAVKQIKKMNRLGRNAKKMHNL